jgi:type I restriction enzyme S subunit
LEIPFPPLLEQRRIAAILDGADALRTARQQELASINAAVNDRVQCIVASSPAKVRFGDLLAEPLRNGISPSRAGLHEADVLTLSAITHGSFDAEQRKSDTFTAPHSADKLVTEGLHLICRGNGNANLVGAMVAAPQTMPGVAFPDTMIATRPSSAIKSAALLAAWRSDGVREQIRRSARTTNGTFKVNQQTLAAIQVPVGTPSQQDEIAALEHERKRLTEVMGTSSAHIASLFASLQHRAFRGEL